MNFHISGKIAGPPFMFVRILGSHTLCFSLSSLLNGALMMTRRSLEGALKCALRDFRREEAISISKRKLSVSRVYIYIKNVRPI